MKKIFVVFLSVFLLSCSGKNIKLIKLDNFDEKKYLGKWYEVARIDNTFERNLVNATAEYSLNKDGTIKVINKAYDKKRNKEKKAEANAKIIDKGILKVYFTPVFGGNYNVLYVNDTYDYAVVGGGKAGYLWILSRDKNLDDKIYNDLVEIAKDRGYNTDLLQKF